MTQSKIAQVTHHPRALAGALICVLLVTSLAGAVIGLQLVTTLGIIPNTAFIGVVVAIALSRVPLRFLKPLRSVHTQNLVQTNISTATFISAASLMVPITLAVLMDMQELIPAVVIGAVAGMLIDLMLLYWLFDSRLFPASNAWPQGAAAAEALAAGDEGGRRAGLLGVGAVIGAAGAWVGIPMSAFAVAFLGNFVALLMFGIGLLARAYFPALFGIDLAAEYIAHGILIGAGIAALAQAARFILKRPSAAQPAHLDRDRTSSVPSDASTVTRTDAYVGKVLARGFVLYLGAATLVAFVAGLWTELSPLAMIGWILYVVATCLASQFIIGLSAMHAGWFPTFGTSLLFLTVGMVLGFPVPALVALCGVLIAGGPAFADSGYDLKAGWIVRGRGADPAFELDGRRQQIIAGVVGMAVSIAVVLIAYQGYIDRGAIPPIDVVYAATLDAGAQDGVGTTLMLWAIPGALIQLLGGSKRQMGILLGTGLLILNAAAGWAVMAGLLLRLVWTRVRRDDEDDQYVTILASGMIAGDAIYGFGDAAVSSVKLS